MVKHVLLVLSVRGSDSYFDWMGDGDGCGYVFGYGYGLERGSGKGDGDIQTTYGGGYGYCTVHISGNGARRRD